MYDETQFNPFHCSLYCCVISIDLGGNCCIRVPNKLVFEDGKELTYANGTNQNRFYTTANTKEQIITNPESFKEVILPETYLFDLPTKTGKTYILYNTSL